MRKLKQGDNVRIVTRAVTPEDDRSGLYYTHYAGLPGTVSHIYPDGEVAVEIRPEALPVEVRSRHKLVRDQMKTKWLDGLSEEGRSRLTEREKDFRLRYVVLVAAQDIEPDASPPPPSTSEPESAANDERPVSESPHRPTRDDLNRAEEEELLRRRKT